VKRIFAISALMLQVAASGQSGGAVYNPDNGDGTYKNPIIHADYSDPDVVRVGADYYMTSSSFEDVPGLPILHSNDLVNWKLIGHALTKLVPEEHFSSTRHGEGVWAPSIRYRNGEYLIYYPDPDFGIYLVKAKHPAGPWSEPILVEAGKGLIDPCPLWDDDGNVYLVHAFAGSRAGIKSILVIKKMNAAATKTIDKGVIVYDGHENDPTIEGPKIYKRNNWYYIFAPAGGVSTGWQLVLRAKNIYGPYERKVVMDQGSTSVNGPHQGAWVNTTTGEDWFIHFQDKKAFGRVVHLQPMRWKEEWPVIGSDKDGDGKGEPVISYKKPSTGKSFPLSAPAASDEFNGNSLGLQWQWPANPRPVWAFPNPANGSLRLFSAKTEGDLWSANNVLQQKFSSEYFEAKTKLKFYPNAKLENEEAGLAVMGTTYASLGVKKTKLGNQLVYTTNTTGEKTESVITAIGGGDVYLAVAVAPGAKCTFSYSLDGNQFIKLDQKFTATPGKWKGAKLGIYCVRDTVTNDSGYADYDWFKVYEVK
jgi:beta-xylosidase